jgi:hypothetical protein
VTFTLEHVLVPDHDREASAHSLSEVLGVEYLGLGSTARPLALARVWVGPTTLDVVDAESFETEPYAFQVSEEELDTILARASRMHAVTKYADPDTSRKGD